MKKNLAKIASVLMVLVMALALTACGSMTVSEFVKEKGAELETKMEEAMKEQEIDCECEVKADGTKLVVDVKIALFDSLGEMEKKAIREEYKNNKAAMTAQIKPQFKDAKEEVSDLSAVVYNMCDSTGEVIVTMEIPMD